MPFHSLETLEAWLEEFRKLGYPALTSLRVISQDGSDGNDTGLIALDLINAPTTAFIEPGQNSDPKWVVTFEGRDDPFRLDAAQVVRLAAEMTTLSALVAFLQAKATEMVIEG